MIDFDAEYMTLQQATEALADLQVSRRTLTRHAETLPSARRVGNRWRIPVAEVERIKREGLPR